MNYLDTLKPLGAFPAAKQLTGPAFDKRLEQLNASLPKPLPDDYITFLRECGGYAFEQPVTFDMDGKPSPLQAFYGLIGDDAAYDLILNLDMLENVIPEEMLPIALDPFGNSVLFDVTGGAIAFWDDELEEVSPVAESLEEFLQSLKVSEETGDA